MDMTPRRPRTAVRALVVLVGLAAATLASPAHAAPPETWEDPDNASALWYLLVLVGVPLAVVAVVTLLVYLPSMMRGQSSTDVAEFRDPEWFGGPRAGVAGATAAEHANDEQKGGASARW